MKHDPIASGKRKSVNLTMDTGIVAAAREAGVNLSQVSEAAVRKAWKEIREAQWRKENREALEGWNRWVDKNGLPLENYRLF